jgi:hypothetical protein
VLAYINEMASLLTTDEHKEEVENMLAYFQDSDRDTWLDKPVSWLGVHDLEMKANPNFCQNGCEQQWLLFKTKLPPVMSRGFQGNATDAEVRIRHQGPNKTEAAHLFTTETKGFDPVNSMTMTMFLPVLEEVVAVEEKLPCRFGTWYLSNVMFSVDTGVPEGSHLLSMPPPFIKDEKIKERVMRERILAALLAAFGHEPCTILCSGEVYLQMMDMWFGAMQAAATITAVAGGASV